MYIFERVLKKEDYHLSCCKEHIYTALDANARSSIEMDIILQVGQNVLTF